MNHLFKIPIPSLLSIRITWTKCSQLVRSGPPFCLHHLDSIYLLPSVLSTSFSPRFLSPFLREPAVLSTKSIYPLLHLTICQASPCLFSFNHLIDLHQLPPPPPNQPNSYKPQPPFRYAPSGSLTSTIFVFLSFSLFHLARPSALKLYQLALLPSPSPGIAVCTICVFS